MISRGHKEHDILYEYGIDKLFAYQQAGMMNEMKHLKDLALINRASYHIVKPNDWDDFMNSMKE